MRYLLLSDIHGNDIALEAVLDDARRRRWDQVLFLGDLVGYYTRPEQAARRLMELEPAVCLMGNHDQLLLDLADGKPGSNMNMESEIVTFVIGKHLEELSSESIEFLRGFRSSAKAERWQAVHGALLRRWDYISSMQSAQANFPLLERPICFVGHTHVPKVFASVNAGREELWRVFSFDNDRTTYRIPPRARLFFNPGSIGQPRDGSPLASYAIYDEEMGTIELRRVEFDLVAVQRSVRENGYPEPLAARLAKGR
ncbi:MAG TPA: metallophosphoesterase family protein [Trueperaceae bacterium]